jgi:putative phage-type endonuclease
MAISDANREERKTGLGGSDAPTVIGVNPFTTSLELYLEKTGDLVKPDLDSRFIEWGERLEPLVAQKYVDETGRKIRVDNRTYRSKDHPFMLGHIDRRVVGGDDRRALEVKTTSLGADWGQTGGGWQDIPMHVLCQIQHYAYVIGLDVVDVAVLIGGNDFRMYEIPRMDDFIRRLVEAEEAFWDRVQARVPPTPDFEHRSTLELLSRLYPGTNGSVVDLGELGQKYHDVMKDAREQRQLFEKVEEGCKARISMLIGEASIGMLPDGSAYTRKLVERKEFTVSASSSMQMRHTTRLPKAATEAMDGGKTMEKVSRETLQMIGEVHEQG